MSDDGDGSRRLAPSSEVSGLRSTTRSRAQQPVDGGKRNGSFRAVNCGKLPLVQAEGLGARTPAGGG